MRDISLAVSTIAYTNATFDAIDLGSTICKRRCQGKSRESMALLHTSSRTRDLSKVEYSLLYYSSDHSNWK